MPHGLAETVGVSQLVGADRHRIEPLEQAEILQLLDGVGQGVDADAEFADGVGLLIDLAVDTAGMTHQRRGQAADAAADNDRLHHAPLVVTRIPSTKFIASKGLSGNPGRQTG